MNEAQSDVRYWEKTHEKYAQTDWINKPSLFALWAAPQLPGTGSLLELGAGQGQDSRYFAELGYRVVATDFSDAALARARQQTGEASNIDYRLVDLSQPLPFGPAEFEVVYSHLALHYFNAATTTRIFNDILHLLKPSGYLVVLVNSVDDPEVAQGKNIEPGFLEYGAITKRFFSTESLKDFLGGFEILTLDNLGTTYKDEAVGVHNLVRLIAQKPKEE